jgi:hypothetical protein
LDFQYLIPGLKQRSAKRNVATLINKETHDGGSSGGCPGNDHGLLMGNRICSKTDCGLYILGNKLWIGVQKDLFPSLSR